LRKLSALLLLVWLAVDCCAVASAAQEGMVAPEHHPWGRFEPGAWKRVRVITETLDEQDHVSSTSSTETKTTLLRVDPDGVILEVRVTVEVAGKRFEVEPQVIKQGFHGEVVCPTLKLTKTAPGEAVIEGHRIPCQIVEIECPSASSKTVTKVYYSDTVAPFVLKRESVTTKVDGGETQNETVAEVTALQMPRRVMAETHTASFVRTLQKLPKGSITTWASTTEAVPGGVISHSSKELDAEGRLIRRGTLEMVDYSLEPEPQRPGVFGRIRSGPLRPFYRPAPPR
jgi:hypothetical protein